MRTLAIVFASVIGLAALVGGVRAVGQNATPSPCCGPLTLTLVEHGGETVTDLGAPGVSAGDLVAWGPNPLYDAIDATDTGAVTQGSCQVLGTSGDRLCIEEIVFPDGSTLSIQGVQPTSGARSTRTIVGGSGRYLHASGTLTVEASADRARWTKTLEIWT
jgi:hypothetical protein